MMFEQRVSRYIALALLMRCCCVHLTYNRHAAETLSESDYMPLVLERARRGAHTGVQLAR